MLSFFLIVCYVFVWTSTKLCVIPLKGATRLDLDLRKPILANIAENDQEQLEATIVDAVQSGEEKMLPGLGVLFELIWKQSSPSEREQMVNALEEGVKQATE